MQASGLCRILNARCATAPALCGSWTTSVGSKRHSPGSGIVPEQVRVNQTWQAGPSPRCAAQHTNRGIIERLIRMPFRGE